MTDTLPTSGNIADFTNRVFHADCMDLLAVLPDVSIDMVLCDLPYGVTAAAWDTIIPFEPMWQKLKRIVKKKGAMVFTATQPFTSKLVSSNYSMFRYEWVINKVKVTRHLDAKYRPLNQHESALVFSQERSNYYPQMRQGQKHDTVPFGTRKEKTTIYGDFGDYREGFSDLYYPTTILNFAWDLIPSHPTQKPVALFEYLIKTYSREGEIVLDFCSGSGTTAIACLNLDRRYILCDLHEPYVTISRERIARHDPFTASPLSNGGKQLSLFEKKEGDS